MVSLASETERLKALKTLCLGYKDGNADKKLLQIAKSIWEGLHTKKKKSVDFWLTVKQFVNKQA